MTRTGIAMATLLALASSGYSASRLSRAIERSALAALDSGRTVVRGDSVLVYGTRTNGADTKGGRWACAKFASLVLKNAGAVSKVSLSVRGVESALAGWYRVTDSDSLRPGDVVVWTRRYDAPEDGACTGGGTCHVGIFTEKGFVHNSPLEKRPVLDGVSLWAFRFKAAYRAP